MSSLMLQYLIMKHSKKTTKWEVMTCKNSIISIKKGYQETMYQNLSYDIFTMPDQYQRKHLIYDQIWQLLKYV